MNTTPPNSGNNVYQFPSTRKVSSPPTPNPSDPPRAARASAIFLLGMLTACLLIWAASFLNQMPTCPPQQPTTAYYPNPNQ